MRGKFRRRAFLLIPAAALALSAVPAVAAGGDGATWAWGSNARSQLAAAPPTGSSVPLSVAGVTGAVSIATGDVHVLVLRRDGTVMSWGGNDGGQLGNGNTVDNSSPATIPGLDHVSQVSAGGGHSLALKSDKTLWAWGHDSDSELGLPNQVEVPTQVPGLPAIIAVAAGSDHNLALAADGTVWSWGKDDYGQVGVVSADMCEAHSRPCVRVPTQVPGLTGVVAVGAGADHSLVLKSDRSLWAWGRNDYGQLGIGTSSSAVNATPTQVSGLSGVTAFGGGNRHSAALTGGVVWAWGDNEYGQLGQGTSDNTPHPTPLSLALPSGATGLDVGGYHTIILKSDGSALSWGRNHVGQLGNGTETTSGCQCLPSAVAASGLSGLDLISGGLLFSVAATRPPYARTEDGSLAQVRYQGSWTTYADGRASGGTVHVARLISATASFTWTGTDVRLVAARAPNLAIALVNVDGASTQVDLYASTPQPQQVVYERHDLAPGTHTLQVTPTGKKNARATNYFVVLDAVDAR